MKQALAFLTLLALAAYPLSANDSQFTPETIKWFEKQESEKKRIKWSDFYKLKNQVKTAVEAVAKRHGDNEFINEAEATALKLELVQELLKVREGTPFKFDVVYQKPDKSTGQIVPELVLTVMAKYEDARGDIVWGFNTVFYNYKIEFYSVNKVPVNPGDYYNYLTLYKA